MRRWLIYPIHARGLHAAAVISPVVAVVLALLVPSTGSCPLPKTPASMGDCPYDHHILLKVLIVLAGIAVSIAAEFAARRDTRSVRTAETQS
jgi:hypothetical protein